MVHTILVSVPYVELLAPVARPVIEDFTPSDSSGSAAAPSAEAAPSALRQNTAANKAQFQSVRPTKKKDL